MGGVSFVTQVIKKGQVGMNLTEGSILRCLLIFAIPIVLTNLVQQLYSMVDLAAVSYTPLDVYKRQI